MYHSISEDAEIGVGHYYRVATSPKRFSDQMQWLHDRGYEVISLAQLLHRMKKGSFPSGHCAVLTFDDGFHDFLKSAWPVLLGFNYKASVFLPTAFVGVRRKFFKGRACLTWREVRELSDHGISFGSHTVNHAALHRLDWKSVQSELHDSRAQIEDRLQAPVDSFAYPYAFPQEDRRFVRRLKQELEEQGYRIAVTTVLGRVQPGNDPLCLQRLPVNDSDDSRLFEAKIAGAYDWMGRFQALYRRVKSQWRAIPSVVASR